MGRLQGFYPGLFLPYLTFLQVSSCCSCCRHFLFSGSLPSVLAFHLLAIAVGCRRLGLTARCVWQIEVARSVLARRSFVVGHSAVAVRRQLGSLPPILGPFVRTKLAISRRSFSGFWTRMGLVVEGCCSFFLWLSVVVVHRIWW